MYCEYCHKKHDGTYGSGRFCSESCSRKFSSKFVNRKELKELKCQNCGKIFYGKANSSQKICNDCHNIKKCLVCGKDNCDNEFCKKFNIRRVKSLMKLFNIDKKYLGTPDIEKIIKDNINKIKDLYFNQHLPEYKIGEMFGLSSPNNMSKIFNLLYIEKRSRRDTALNFLLYLDDKSNQKKINQNYQYKSGNYTTWNNKIVYLRSSYELEYAQYLDDLKIDYEVENLRIKYFDNSRKLYRCAIPDFYIPEKNLIIEIKSSWTLDIDEMKSKIIQYKKLGYDFKLIFNKKERNIEDIKYSEITSNKNNSNKIGFYGWKWMNKDNITKKINKDNVKKYIELGWNIGRK